MTESAQIASKKLHGSFRASGNVYGIENMISIYLCMDVSNPNWIVSDSALIGHVSQQPYLLSIVHEEILQNHNSRTSNYNKNSSKSDIFRSKPKNQVREPIKVFDKFERINGTCDDDTNNECFYKGRIPVISIQKKNLPIVIKNLTSTDKSLANDIFADANINNHCVDEIHSDVFSACNSKDELELTDTNTAINNINSDIPRSEFNLNCEINELSKNDFIVQHDDTSPLEVIKDFDVKKFLCDEKDFASEAEKEVEENSIIFDTKIKTKTESKPVKVLKVDKKNNSETNHQKIKVLDSNTLLPPQPYKKNIYTRDLEPVSFASIENEQKKEYLDSIDADRRKESKNKQNEKITGSQKLNNSPSIIKNNPVNSNHTKKNNTQYKKKKIDDKQFWDKAVKKTNSSK